MVISKAHFIDNNSFIFKEKASSSGKAGQTHYTIEFHKIGALYVFPMWFDIMEKHPVQAKTEITHVPFFYALPFRRTTIFHGWMRKCLIYHISLCIIFH